MADYGVLKAAIQAVIKQNGNNEITGNLLQQALMSIISSLGAAYQFVGVATPETNPGTPDQNVFYFASIAGTYTNFGGIVVGENELVVLKGSGGNWSKTETGIPRVSLSHNTETGHTDVNVAGMTTPVASIEDLAEIDYNFGTKAKAIPMASGYIVCNGNVGTAVNLTPVSHSTYKHAVVECVEGDVFYIKGKGGNSDRLYCFVDQDNKIIFNITGGTTYGENVKVIAPTGASKLIINDETGVGVSYYGESYSEQSDRSFYDVERVIFDDKLDYDIVQSGKYYNYAKELVTLAPCSVASVSVENRKRLIVKCRSGALMCSFWKDANNQLHYAFCGNNEDGINTQKSIYVPNFAKQLLISYVTDNGLDVIACGNTNVMDICKQLNEMVNASLQLDSTVTGKYLDINGSEQNLSTGVIDKYIIHLCSQIHIKARIGGLMYIIFYDGDNNILTKYAGNDGAGINVDADFNVPEGCSYVRVSYVNDFPCEVNMLIESIQEQVDSLDTRVTFLEGEIGTNPWVGKKIGLIGDSIAAGSAATDATKRFISVAASLLGASYKNAAIGGWYLGDQLEDGEHKSVWRQVNGVSPATTSLDGDEDVVVIWAGTNDFGHDFAIGEPYTILESAQGGYNQGHKLPTTDADTTCGGLVKTIQTLYAKYGGYIPILICLPLQRKSAGGNGTTHGSYGGSWDRTIENDRYMDDYIDGILKTANYYGIPVADFYHNNMNPNIAAANTKYFGTTSVPGGDGLHPNDLGHRLIGERLAKILKKEILFED